MSDLIFLTPEMCKERISFCIEKISTLPPTDWGMQEAVSEAAGVMIWETVQRQLDLGKTVTMDANEVICVWPDEQHGSS